MPVADEYAPVTCVVDRDLRAESGHEFDVCPLYGDDVLAGVQVGQEVVMLRPLPAVLFGKLADLLAIDENRELVVDSESQLRRLGFLADGHTDRAAEEAVAGRRYFGQIGAGFRTPDPLGVHEGNGPRGHRPQGWLRSIGRTNRRASAGPFPSGRACSMRWACCRGPRPGPSSSRPAARPAACRRRRCGPSRRKRPCRCPTGRPDRLPVPRPRRPPAPGRRFGAVRAPATG